MLHLALDKQTGDLILSDTGVARVSEGRFVVQQVQSKLRTILGEWVLDPSVGWANLGDLRKNYDTTDLVGRARKIILETQGVLSINSLTSEFDSKERRLRLLFSANTIYGTINSEVPWE